MAIGSAPEYGVVFGTYGEMKTKQKQEWFNHIRTVYGPDLLGGYATLAYPPGREPK